ncbi:hypothetical protein [Allorhodopirellula heiligendammensis]|uniref:Uncharacterized protein n=1 Tax=Allorhodopirellula heiligendammensis TaxID=2714739 RepID=A0A5C6C2X3_9BACT|nr:hypothetical protein [Allorhodopirellula heiligendammensis]TWU18890.1 hypothetical protein Poly21_10610 [Allorhodopirellula heiligendammensis]
MATEQDKLDDLVTGLKQQRDHLRVRMSLAEMEAKQEYDRLSDQISKLTEQYEPIRSAAAESAGDALAALTLAAEEMKSGLQKVVKAVEETK